MLERGCQFFSLIPSSLPGSLLMRLNFCWFEQGVGSLGSSPSPVCGGGQPGSMVVCRSLRVGLLAWILQRECLGVPFPGGASVKEPACQCRRHKRCGFDPWVWKISWRRAWQPTPVFLSGKFHRQRSLVGYTPWGLKELDKTEVT